MHLMQNGVITHLYVVPEMMQSNVKISKNTRAIKVNMAT